MATLHATGISRTIQGTTLLDPVDVSIGPGECVALVGANGSGKTTLLRLLAARDRPTTGTITLDGQPLDERRAQARRAISSLIGTPALYPDMTVDEQLTLIMASWSLDADESRARGERVLTDFDLLDLRRRFPHELSSGQSQLFQLAVAFVRPAEMYLLDEPEQRLDAHRRGLVARAITAVCADGASVVFASHAPDLVDAVATARIELGR